MDNRIRDAFHRGIPEELGGSVHFVEADPLTLSNIFRGMSIGRWYGGIGRGDARYQVNVNLSPGSNSKYGSKGMIC